MATLDPRSDRADADATPGRTLVLTDGVVQGAVGGVLATVVMTAYRLPIARSLPPTAAFWEHYVAGGAESHGASSPDSTSSRQDDAEDYPLVGLALHVAYGAGAGAVFGALYRLLGIADLPEHGRETAGMVVATVYGLVLSAFGSRVVLGRLLAMDLDPDESLVFHVGHVIYALTLGTWVGSRIGDGE
jgi:hypothetical protein